MDEFYKTRRGQKYLDNDIPLIAEQLKRIADSLEKKNKLEEKRLILEQKKMNLDNLNSLDNEERR